MASPIPVSLRLADSHSPICSVEASVVSGVDVSLQPTARNQQHDSTPHITACLERKIYFFMGTKMHRVTRVSQVNSCVGRGMIAMHCRCSEALNVLGYWSCGTGIF